MDGYDQNHRYEASSMVTGLYRHLASNPTVRKGFDFIMADHKNIAKAQKQIFKIPPPPFKKEIRAADFQRRWVALGLEKVGMDAVGKKRYFKT